MATSLLQAMQMAVLPYRLQPSRVAARNTMESSAHIEARLVCQWTLQIRPCCVAVFHPFAGPRQLWSGGCQQAFSGDVVDFDANAIGVLEESGEVTWRPLTFFGRAHDRSPQSAGHLVHSGNVLARSGAKTYVMQSRAGLIEVQFPILRCRTPDRESGATADTIKVIVGIEDYVRQTHKWKQAPVEGDTPLEVADRN